MHKLDDFMTASDWFCLNCTEYIQRTVHACAVNVTSIEFVTS